MVATATVARAQVLFNSFVAAGGTDTNPCTRDAPCATFAAALAKTRAGGEIDVVDVGVYGPLDITKSITIDGKGLGAASGAGGAVTSAISISAGDNDAITLRNLAVQASDAPRGIWLTNGNSLLIENVTVSGFLYTGIFVNHGTTLAHGAETVTIHNVTISGGPNATGISIGFGTTYLSHSMIRSNAQGLVAYNTGIVDADSNAFVDNGVAVQAGNGVSGQAAALVRLSNNDIYHNSTGFGCGGGVLASAGNNRKGGNTGGTVATCSPTVAITQQ
jgi:hypothetical protein